jgi:hypothetical protein
MTLDVALSGGSLTTYQAVDYAGKWRMSLFPMVSFATARINQSSFDTPLAQLTVDTTSADWLSVRKNMMCWVGSTAGAHDIGIYRVRETPGASTLYIMETSPGDPGLIAKRVTKLFADNQYITIIDAPNIWSIFPRITYSGGSGTFLKDWDETYTSQNDSGGAVPGILRMGGHTIVKVADSATYTESRTASETLYGGSVSSRQWTPPSGASLASGSATSATAGYEYPVGNHLIKYTETLSNTAVLSGQRCVLVHDDTTNPALEIDNLQWDEDEFTRVSCTLVSDFDTDILAGAMVFIWEDVDSTAIASATSYFVGFVDKIGGDIQPGLGTCSLEIISPLAVMSRTHGFSQQLTYAAAPANWQETNIAHYDFWTFYLLNHHTTLLAYFDFFPSGRTSRTRNGWKSGAGSWLEAINGAVDADNAKLTQDPHGNLYLKRDPDLMTTSERSGLVTRLELTAALVSSVRYNRRIRPTVNKVEGYSFSVGTGTPTAYRSQAIGNTGGQGADGQRLTDQLASQSELNARTGNSYAKQNNPYDSISITLVSGYHVINPALRYLINLTITDATLLPEGSTEPLDFDCVPTQVSISWERGEDGNSTPLITLTVVPLSDGNATPGQTMPIEAREGADYTIPSIDALTGFPSLIFDPLIPFPSYFGLPPIGSGFGGTSLSGTPGSGQPTGTIIAFAADIGYLTDNIGDWSQIATFTGEVVLAAMFSNASTPAIVRQWVATREGGIYYSANAISLSHALKQAATGYTVIRAVDGDAAGDSFVAYRPTDYGTWSKTFDFTIDEQGFEVYTEPNYGAEGVYAPGTGWQGTNDSGTNEVFINRILPITTTLTSLSLDYILSGSAANGGQLFANPRYDGSNPPTPTAPSFPTSGTTETATATSNNVSFVAYDARAENGTAGQITFTGGIAQGTGYNPFGTVRTMYSDDNGATVTTRDIADYMGDTGFDTSDFNLGNIAAANLGIWYSSSLSGTYTELTGLTGINGTAKVSVIREPYRKLATQALNDSHTSRQFIYGTSSAVSGKTLWGITFNDSSGAIATQSDMTPIIATVTYYIVGAQALETYGANTQLILAFAKPVGGGSTVLIGSDDGGGTWEVRNTSFDGNYVRFLPEVWGGNGSIALLTGTDGAVYTTDFGDTLTDLTGDFTSDVAALPMMGGYEIGE